MVVRYMLAAILAGVLAGLFMSGAQAVKVWPLILEAEKYEGGAAPDATHQESEEQSFYFENFETAVSTHSEETHADGVAVWGPEDGLERILYSVVSNIITATAYSLVLTAAILFSGQAINWQSGLVWGACGFITFMLVPSLGLPPEVPGTVAASVEERQIWWTVTVAMTAAGLALFFFKRQWHWAIFGVLLMIAPHIYGAPQPEHHSSLAPAWITAEFVVATIATGLVFWLFLGGVLGLLLGRITTDEA